MSIRPVTPPRRGRAGGRPPHYRARLLAFTVVVVLLMGTLLGRLAQVQLLRHEDYAAAARTVNTRDVVDPALRGRILAADGQPLVDNGSTAVVTVDRTVLLDAADGGRALVHRLARRLGVPYQRLWDRTRLCGTPGAPPSPVCWNGSPYQPVPVASGVEPRRALGLLERPEELPGVAVVAEPVRRYPHPHSVNAAHLVGYLGRPTAAEERSTPGLADTMLVGRAGLEAQYDDVLRGRSGVTTVAIDPRGAVTRRLSHTDPVPGDDLVTHIRPRVQAAAERALAATVRADRRAGNAADSGAAVVLDVRTGAVAALASYPTYRPEVWTGGISERELAHLSDPAAGTPLVDRVTSALEPPASTFKVVTLPAAVSDGNPLHGRYDCSSSVRVGDRLFHNYESEAYGEIGLQRALAVSCDTIFYRFAYRSWLDAGGLRAPVGVHDPYVAMARDFGLGRPTGIDLPGESAGRVPDRRWKREQWEQTKGETCARARSGYPQEQDRARAAYLTELAKENCAGGYEYRAGDAVNFSIGQGDTMVTPIQLAQVYAAVANGGTLWRPQVAAGVRAPDGHRVRTIAPVREGTVHLDPATLRLMHAGLQDVVTEGTAASAFRGFPLGRFPVAGKTGTGEVYGQGSTAWFASYAPADHPRYAVVVMVAQGGTGATGAAPAARDIWDTIRRLR